MTFPEHDAVGLTFTGGAGAALATLSSKVRTRMDSMSSFILIIATPGADEIIQILILRIYIYLVHATTRNGQIGII